MRFLVLTISSLHFEVTNNLVVVLLSVTTAVAGVCVCACMHAISKLGQFRSPHICLCLSEETLKAGGPFCLVSMPGEVKDPTQGVNV